MRRQKCMLLLALLLILAPQVVVFIRLDRVGEAEGPPDQGADEAPGPGPRPAIAAADPRPRRTWDDGGEDPRDAAAEERLRPRGGRGAERRARRLAMAHARLPVASEGQPARGGGTSRGYPSDGPKPRLPMRTYENQRDRQVKADRRWSTMLQNMSQRLFLDEMGPESDSVCQLPALKAPPHTCPDGQIGWDCSMVPQFSHYDSSTRNITVNCAGRFRVNQVDRTEFEEIVARGSYRRPAIWRYYQGPQEITMETEYADVVCKSQKLQDLHNYHTQFLARPAADRLQARTLQAVLGREPRWRPLSVLTVVLDSMSRAQAHRSCGLPKTMALLKKLQRGYFHDDQSGSGPSSHQSFFFNRLNSISGSTVLNLTPLFSGQLYQDDLDAAKLAKGIYAKDIQEWVWQYAAGRGYLTSYGVDNNSGMMGTRTHCKACHYRPPVLAHVEHGWQKRENEQVRPNVLSGLCDGNRMLHEHILNYTRDFLRHPHPAKWAGLDLNAGHRRETVSGNQVDSDLASFLEDVLQDNKDLVVFVLGDHGKPLHSDPSQLGSYYETLLPFLSILVPRWLLREQPDLMENLVGNQQGYIVHADLHLSMKSLLHYPYMGRVGGAVASKALNIFTQPIPRGRSCEQANIPPWTCVCGFMQKLPESQWTPRHFTMVQKALEHVNAMHGPERLVAGGGLAAAAGHPPATSCLDLTLRRLLNVLVNENREEGLDSARRFVHHLTFQTVQEDTVWSVVMDNGMDIKQVKQVSLYQPYDVCWDRRVPLQYCVCDKTLRSSPSKTYQQLVR